MPSVISRALEMAESALEKGTELCESSRGKQIAQTIVKQLKTADAWAMASWGANELIALEDGLQFKVKGSNIKSGGRVQIRLNAADTYDIRLIRVRGSSVKEVGSADGVYADQLVDILDGLIG